MNITEKLEKLLQIKHELKQTCLYRNIILNDNMSTYANSINQETNAMKEEINNLENSLKKEIGYIYAYSASEQNIPEGYLLCDGSTLRRDYYNDLFNVIGTTYGQGNIEYWKLENDFTFDGINYPDNAYKIDVQKLDITTKFYPGQFVTNGINYWYLQRQFIYNGNNLPVDADLITVDTQPVVNKQYYVHDCIILNNQFMMAKGNFIYDGNETHLNNAVMKYTLINYIELTQKTYNANTYVTDGINYWYLSNQFIYDGNNFPNQQDKITMYNIQKNNLYTENQFVTNKNNIFALPDFRGIFLRSYKHNVSKPLGIKQNYLIPNNWRSTLANFSTAYKSHLKYYNTSFLSMAGSNDYTGGDFQIKDCADGNNKCVVSKIILNPQLISGGGHVDYNGGLSPENYAVNYIIKYQ